MASIRECKLKSGGTAYEIRVSRGRDPVSGKQLSPYTMRYTPPEGYSAKRALKEAQVAAAQFEADCRAGKVLTKQEEIAQRKAQAEAAERERLEAAAMPTFREYAERWLSDATAQRERTPGTLRNFRIALDRILPLIGGYKLQEIDHLIMRQCVAQFFAEGANRMNGAPLSYDTKVQTFTKIKVIFEAAVDGGLIEESPMDRVKLPKRPKGDAPAKKMAFTEEETRHILDCAAQEPLMWRAMITFMLDSGCRIGETVALRWDHINFEDHSVSITDNAQYTKETGVYITTPKNGRSRTVLLNPQALKVMREWKRAQALDLLSKGIPQSAYCFTNALGKMIYPGSPAQYFARFGKRYNIPGFHPHALRHTMISLSITNGADVVSVSKKAGHADPSITLKVYSHASEEAQRRANELLAAQIYKEA